MLPIFPGVHIWLEARLWKICDRIYCGHWPKGWQIDNRRELKDTQRHVIDPPINTEEKRILIFLIFTIPVSWFEDLCVLSVINKLYLLSTVSAGGSAYTGDRYETRLFKQQDPRLQVNIEGDPHPFHNPFQLNEGSPHGGCGGQTVQKVVSSIPKPLVWLCVGQGWCLQPEGLWLVWSFW